MGRSYRVWRKLGSLISLAISIEAFESVMKIVAPTARDVSPTLGLIPTALFTPVGDMMLTSVSVPRVTAARPIDAMMAELDDEPRGSPFG